MNSKERFDVLQATHIKQIEIMHRITIRGVYVLIFGQMKHFKILHCDFFGMFGVFFVCCTCSINCYQ